MIFAPYGSDGAVLHAALRAANVPATLCASPAELYGAAQGEVGTFLLSQEALSPRVRDLLVAVHENQPSWSTVPVVLLLDREMDGGGGEARPERSEAPGYGVTRLRRPVAETELVSVVRLALNARARQFMNRDLLKALGEANAHLETKVAARTAELRLYAERLEREIEARSAAEAQLRRARARLAERREETRRRLGRDLHDDVLQRVLLLNMHLRRGLRGSLPKAVAAQFRDLAEEVLGIASGIRRVIRQLRPPGLDLGVVGALEGLVGKVRERQGNAPRVRLHADLDEEPPQEVALCLYRCAQELIRNGVRHARAQRIEVRLEARGGRAVLTVADDGVGFEPPERLSELGLGEHFGLLGVEEHAQALGGSLALASAPGEGTRAVVELPLRRDGGDDGREGSRPAP